MKEIHEFIFSSGTKFSRPVHEGDKQVIYDKFFIHVGNVSLYFNITLILIELKFQ